MSLTKLLGSAALAAVWFVSPASMKHAEAACQWNYSDVDNVATAFYCGNIVVAGTASFNPGSFIAPITVINPSSTLYQFTFGSSGNPGPTAFGLLFDPTSIPAAGGFKFSAFNYTAFGFTNGASCGGPANYTDDVWTQGINVASSGQRIDGTKAAEYLQFESNFCQGGLFGQEFHFDTISAGGVIRRPFSTGASVDGSFVSTTLSANLIRFANIDGTADTLQIDTIQKILELQSTTSILGGANGIAMIKQPNAAGNAFLPLPFINASNQSEIDEPVFIVAATTQSVPGINITESSATAESLGLTMNLANVTGQRQGFEIFGDATGALYNTIANVDTTHTGANSTIVLQTGGPGGGSPFLDYNVVGDIQWRVGLDNTDDAWKGCSGGFFGVGACFDFYPNGAYVIGSLQVLTPTTGSTVVVPAGMGKTILDPAGTLATLTIILPPSPVNGQTWGYSTSQVLTALTMNTSDGSTIKSPITASAAGNNNRWVYVAASTTWYRSP